LIRHRFLAVFAVAFWLLATHHCGLEAAGIFDAHAAELAQDCCTGGELHCSHDGCEVIEGSGILYSTGAKAPQPSLAVCLCLMCPRGYVAERGPAPRQRGDEFGRPLGWIATWQFVQRAAPLSRAPSLVLA
jgi:hypothetical protein